MATTNPHIPFAHPLSSRLIHCHAPRRSPPSSSEPTSSVLRHSLLTQTPFAPPRSRDLLLPTPPLRKAIFRSVERKKHHVATGSGTEPYCMDCSSLFYLHDWTLDGGSYSILPVYTWMTICAISIATTTGNACSSSLSTHIIVSRTPVYHSFSQNFTNYMSHQSPDVN
jgi:hypothetical protein